MKKILFLIVLIATFYFVVSDGLMVHFNLEQSHQYAFNFAGILIISPACLFGLLGMEFKEDKQ